MAKDFGFYQAAHEIAEAQSWDRWHEEGSWSPDERFIDVLGLVQVVHRKNDERDEGYGEYRQGSTDEISVTLQVDFRGGETRYFRKYGTSNSYGDPEWDGKFIEVKPAQQIVTIFEEG